ncbi:MAG TPA: 2-polyprenyl-3-methyl-6-methoxy-1,4-benzoquinone monooxygenase [Burkholderiaceae bacterium]|nr:2-polyprenyl-3-methyl-6-methoxy-1,4-benzoquinone monooxygenase [Burkholderiaceae bacterium]
MKQTGLSLGDQLIAAADRALRTLASHRPASRANPATAIPTHAATPLSERERREAAALMRVNHVGEVCAQAMYDAQALAASDSALRETFVRAAREEADHLAWTQQRITELGGRTSLLNPLWYGGAFAIGTLAARMGDRVSLGFLAETERQVERHLESHLQRLPVADIESRAIVEQMKHEEAQHADSAVTRGAATLPYPARLAMRLAARLMTKTARHL